MKSRTWMWMNVVYLFAALAMPVCVAAQDNPSQDHKSRHHQYKLVDVGTFGGPASYINNPFALGAPNQINSNGTTVGAAATPIPSPPNSNTSVCEGIDGNTPFVFHAFKWQDGVVTDLGSLPGPDNCSVATSINEDGEIAGYSENGLTDPLTGIREIRAVRWKDGKIKDLGTFGGNQSLVANINDRGQIFGDAMNTVLDPYSLYYNLSHPNICTIYEFGEHEGQPFLVMELLEGETLREVISNVGGEGSQLPLERLLDIAIRISDGLEAAHQKGITHRDIKPANIFVTTQGQVKILDFGLAKLAAAAVGEAEAEELRGNPATLTADGPLVEHTLTRTGLAMGTAGYMSPEQVRGEKLDARTDLFSFGLVLYEMATGQRAFSGNTAAILKEAILNQTPVPVSELNSTTPTRLEQIIGKAIEKSREKRYQSAADMRVDLQQVKGGAQPVTPQPPLRHWKLVVIAVFIVAILIVAGYFWHRQRQAATFSSSDTVILADFTNLTSDPVFGPALKAALEIEFGQTPFLNVLSAEKVRGTLKLMGRPEDAELTPQLARDVCGRTNSRAVLEGSISDSGNQYRLEVKAVDCKTGKTLADSGAEAGKRSQVVSKLGEVGNDIRKTLGEPPDSLQRFNKPLDEAATPSVEALQAYAAGAAIFGKPDAIPHLKRAVELDANFALAYRLLSSCYNNLMQDQLELETATKAYQLRKRASHRDELEIEANYYSVTGEWEKAISTWEQITRDFPRWGRPRHLIGYGLTTIGQYEPAAVAEQDALRLMPDNMSPNGILARAYSALGRLDDAKLVLDRAKVRTPDSWNLHWWFYRLAFLQDDKNSMREQVEWAMNKPDVEDLILREQSRHWLLRIWEMPRALRNYPSN